MELFLRKYFWILELAGIITAAYIFAQAANAYIEFKFQNLPEMKKTEKLTTSSYQKRKKEPAIDMKAIRERNPFGGKTPQQLAIESALLSEEEPDEEYTGTCVYSEELPQSSSRLDLIATLKTRNPKWSIAVIHDASSNETQVYGPKSPITDDITLEQILRGKVVVLNEQKCEVLDLKKERALSIGRPSFTSRARPSSSSSSAEGVKKLSETEYMVSRDEVEKSLMNLSKIATQARIVPHFKKGKPSGFKLFSIRPGSIYAKIGIRNGDIVKKINGYEIDTPEKALELYQKLKEADNVSIEIERRGQSKTMNYQIR